MQEGSIDIAQDMSGVLHIYLPLNRLSPNNLGAKMDTTYTNISTAMK